MTDSELDARLKYLDSSFTELEDPYTYWQYGWTGVYATSTAVSLYKAMDEDNSDDSTKEWVTAFKSAGGLTLMLMKPVPLVFGVDDVRAMPVNTRQAKIARLAEAEKMLEHTAWRADDRYKWKPHVMTVGINLLGAAAIAAWGDSDDALGSAALGIALGEAAIWTQPTAAQDKLDSYRGRFDKGEQTAYTWNIVPRLNGVDLIVRF